MIGRVYINEVGSDKVWMEMSSWPSAILSPDDPLGFAYLKTLEHLDISHQAVPETNVSLLQGSMETTRPHISRLHNHIGVIARYGAARTNGFQQKWTRDFIGRTLGNLTEDLSAQPDSLPFSSLLHRITQPFAEAANDPKEIFYMIHDQLPFWYIPRPSFYSSYNEAESTMTRLAKIESAVKAFRESDNSALPATIPNPAE